MKKVIIYGGGPQAHINIKMLHNIANLNSNFFDFKTNAKSKFVVKYIYDSYLKKPSFDTKITFSNKKKDLIHYCQNTDYFVTCVGLNSKARYLVSIEMEKLGLKPLNIISKSSYIDETSILGKGIQIMPNSTIHCFTKFGDYCLINTSATIDHDCIIGNGVNIMGGATLAGNVKIGNYVQVGANSTILPNINISNGAIIGAGAVVTKNVKSNMIVVGNPARIMKTYRQNVNLDDFK